MLKAIHVIMMLPFDWFATSQSENGPTTKTPLINVGLKCHTPQVLASLFTNSNGLQGILSDCEREGMFRSIRIPCVVATSLNLTLKRLGHFFQNVILFSNVVLQTCNIFI